MSTEAPTPVPHPTPRPAPRPIPLMTRIGWAFSAGFGYLAFAILVSLSGFGHAGPGSGGMLAYILGLPGTLAMYLIEGGLLLGLLGGIVQWALIGALVIAPLIHRRAARR